MNEITKRKSSALATNGANPFTAYGDQASQKSIVGQLLRFTKGDYLAGQDDDEVPEGTQFVANMDEMLLGWIRWEANKPTDHIMGKLSEGYQPPRRNELGDTDKEQWEVDATGQQRDPWQFSNYLLMKAVSSDGELYTFTTSSRGGLNALGDLCKVYGTAMAQHTDEYPIVALGVNAYDHPNRAFGRIKVPTFKMVGWAPKAVFADGAEPVAELVAPNESPAGKKPNARF